MARSKKSRSLKATRLSEQFLAKVKAALPATLPADSQRLPLQSLEEIFQTLPADLQTKDAFVVACGLYAEKCESHVENQEEEYRGSVYPVKGFPLIPLSLLTKYLGHKSNSGAAVDADSVELALGREYATNLVIRDKKLHLRFDKYVGMQLYFTGPTEEDDLLENSSDVMDLICNAVKLGLCSVEDIAAFVTAERTDDAVHFLLSDEQVKQLVVEGVHEEFNEHDLEDTITLLEDIHQYLLEEYDMKTYSFPSPLANGAPGVLDSERTVTVENGNDSDDEEEKPAPKAVARRKSQSEKPALKRIPSKSVKKPAEKPVKKSVQTAVKRALPQKKSASPGKKAVVKKTGSAEKKNGTAAKKKKAAPPAKKKAATPAKKKTGSTAAKKKKAATPSKKKAATPAKKKAATPSKKKTGSTAAKKKKAATPSKKKATTPSKKKTATPSSVKKRKGETPGVSSVKKAKKD